MRKLRVGDYQMGISIFFLPSGYFRYSISGHTKYGRKPFWRGIVALGSLLVSGSSAFAQTTLSPPGLSFNNQVINVASAPKAATFKNTQSVAMMISSIAITGGNAQVDYVWGGNCPISPSTLAAGNSCSITVTFTPSALGSRTSTLTVTHSASTSPQTLALAGTSVAPVSLSVNTLNFGVIAVGNTSLAKSVTLTNYQNTPVNFASILPSGDFAVASNTCGSTIAARASCTVGLAFSPTAKGARVGALTITDNAANSPQTVSLTGTGSSPVIVSPLSLTFANLTVGTTAATQTVTLTNRLNTPLAVSAVVATG